jgi:hypothetical protein
MEKGYININSGRRRVALTGALARAPASATLLPSFRWRLRRRCKYIYKHPAPRALGQNMNSSNAWCTARRAPSAGSPRRRAHQGVNRAVGRAALNRAAQPALRLRVSVDK